MKSPICTFDAKSGVLCSKCEARLRSGEISQDDVDASIKLSRLAEKNADVNKFTLVRAVSVGAELALVLKASDVKGMRSNDIVSQKIESEFQKKVWFLEADSSDRAFVELLFYPTRVMSVNLFWLPDGSRMTRVIVAGSREVSRVNLEKVQKIAKVVRNMDLTVEFER